jgi:hypothetical protein
LPVLRAPGSGIRRAARTVLAAPNDLVACLVVVALCVAVGLPTIRPDNYFLGDDFGLVHHLHDLPPVRFPSYFYSDWTEGIYGAPLDELRPFLAFTYWLDSHLFAAVNVRGYHATNVVLHALNGLLVWAIVRSVAAGHKARPLLAPSAARTAGQRGYRQRPRLTPSALVLGLEPPICSKAAIPAGGPLRTVPDCRTPGRGLLSGGSVEGVEADGTDVALDQPNVTRDCHHQAYAAGITGAHDRSRRQPGVQRANRARAEETDREPRFADDRGRGVGVGADGSRGILTVRPERFLQTRVSRNFDQSSITAVSPRACRFPTAIPAEPYRPT